MIGTLIGFSGVEDISQGKTANHVKDERKSTLDVFQHAIATMEIQGYRELTHNGAVQFVNAQDH